MNIGKIFGFSSKTNSVKSLIVNKYVPSEELTVMKSVTNSLGHKYELRGNSASSGQPQVYELYRQLRWEESDKWKRVAAKTEFPLHGNETTIVREQFDPKTGEVVERSFVSPNLILVTGDTLDMSSSMLINPPTMPEQIKLNVFGKDLTPMAKRVLKFIVKNR